MPHASPLTPGPADYHPGDHLLHPRTPAADFAHTSKRGDHHPNEYPAPGSYDPRDPNAPISYTFGHEDRPNTVSRD
jgi:hypothetical protein